jgi:hypothetical protein
MRTMALVYIPTFSGDFGGNVDTYSITMEQNGNIKSPFSYVTELNDGKI